VKAKHPKETKKMDSTNRNFMTKGSGSQNLKYVAVSLSLLIASNSALVPAWAAASKSDKPSGTLLLPLTPKIDQNDVESRPLQAEPA
jgi:hypothetical protein